MKLPANIVYWLIIIVLIGSSSFFTYHIISFQMSLSGGLDEDDTIPSGTEVTLVKVIDGDEISVTHNGDNFIVRILGIKSFDPTVNDPLIAGTANQALEYLMASIGDKTCTLVFDEFKRDSKNRLLSYIECHGQDIGLEMIRKGITLVYTEYVFGRMDQYLEEEATTRSSNTGLWGNVNIRERADKLKLAWKVHE